MYSAYCQDCHETMARSVCPPRCPQCGGLICFDYDYERISFGHDGGTMWDFRAVLPIEPETPPVTLGEGDTPLLESRTIQDIQLFFKDETRNPTGSMKDRALAVAMTKAREAGIGQCIISTTGSAGLSASAYAARAGIRCLVVVPKGMPAGRTLPMQILGAEIYEVDGNTDEATALVETCCRKYGFYDVSTSRRSNPFQAEGAKTIALELAMQCREGFDWLVVPVGGGGTLAGVWRGIREAKELGLLKKTPRILGVQARHYDALVHALRRGQRDEDFLRHALDSTPAPATILVKLDCRFPTDGVEALAAIEESGGDVMSCGDKEALLEVEQIGRNDGIFVEPSSAIVAAAVREAVGQGKIERGDRVAAILSGSGFRELDAIAGRHRCDLVRLPKDGAEIRLRDLAEGIKI